MYTDFAIDDGLINEALLVSGYKTKKETIEEGLKLLIAMKSQAKIKQYRGKMSWEGDLESMRTDK
jgi:Arc/MetJ family transcription regulator